MRIAPAPPQGINSDQIGVAGCEPDRLSTVNQNSGEARELRYQLNFVAADGSRLDCDPIIDNGGIELMHDRLEEYTKFQAHERNHQGGERTCSHHQRFKM